MCIITTYIEKSIKNMMNIWVVSCFVVIL